MGTCVFLVLMLLVALGVIAFAPGVFKACALIPLGISVAYLGYATFVYVPQGHVGVVYWLGMPRTDVVVPAGTIKPFGVWPWESVESHDVRVTNLDFHGTKHFTGPSKDNASMTIDLTLPVRVKPQAVPWILTSFKTEWNVFVEPYVGSSLKDTVVTKTWSEMYQSDRAGFATALTEHLQKNLKRVLMENGVPEAVAEDAFVLSDPQIGSIGLPKEIEDSLHKQSAVKIDQATSVLRAQVAENDVHTREAEGKGYGSLLTNLPPGVTPGDAAAMMNSLATLKSNALLDDLAKAGKLGNVNVTIVYGGGVPSSVPVSK